MTLSIRNTTVLETITLPHKNGIPNKKRLHNIVKASNKKIPALTNTDTDENKPYIKVEMQINQINLRRDEVVDKCLDELDAILQVIGGNSLTFSHKTEKRERKQKDGKKTERFLILMLHR